MFNKNIFLLGLLLGIGVLFWSIYKLLNIVTNDEKLEKIAMIVRDNAIKAFLKEMQIVFIFSVFFYLLSLSLTKSFPQFQSFSLKIFLLGVFFVFSTGCWCIFISSKFNTKIVTSAKKSNIDAIINGIYLGYLVYLPQILFLLFIYFFLKKDIIIISSIIYFFLFCSRVILGFYTKVSDVALDYYKTKVLGEDCSEIEKKLAPIDAAGDLVADMQNTLISILGLISLYLNKTQIGMFLFTGIISTFIPLFFIRPNETKKIIRNYFITSNFLMLFFYFLIGKFNVNINIDSFLNKFFTIFLTKIILINNFIANKFIILFVFLLNIIGYFFVEKFTDGKRFLHKNKIGVVELISTGLFQSFFFVLFFSVMLFLAKELFFDNFIILVFPVMLLDFLGAIADNAGFLAEESSNEKAADILDIIDISGNTIKAFTKYILGLFLGLKVGFAFKNNSNFVISDLLIAIQNKNNYISAVSFLEFSVEVVSSFFIGGGIFFLLIYILNELFLKTTSEILLESPNTKNINDLIIKKSIKVLFYVIPFVFIFPYLSDYIKFGFQIFSLIFGVVLSIAGALWDNMKKERKKYENEIKDEKSIYSTYVLADLLGDIFKDLLGVVALAVLGYSICFLNSSGVF